MLSLPTHSSCFNRGKRLLSQEEIETKVMNLLLELGVGTQEIVKKLEGTSSNHSNPWLLDISDGRHGVGSKS